MKVKPSSADTLECVAVEIPRVVRKGFYHCAVILLHCIRCCYVDLLDELTVSVCVCLSLCVCLSAYQLVFKSLSSLSARLILIKLDVDMRLRSYKDVELIFKFCIN